MHLVTGTVEREVGGLAGWVLQAVGRVKALGWVGASRPERKHMRVVETMSIGPKKQLVLVSCDGERFLVGTGGDSVTTMVRVRPETVAAVGAAR